MWVCVGGEGARLERLKGLCKKNQTYQSTVYGENLSPMGRNQWQDYFVTE